jgi:hypothetical protein
MSISMLFFFVILVALVALWAHHANLSRHAIYMARQHLHSQGLQFLDQSAVLCRLRLLNDPRVGLCLQRTYRFEFSAQGDRRYNGWITLSGRRLSGIELQPFREASNAEPLTHDATLH